MTTPIALEPRDSRWLTRFGSDAWLRRAIERGGGTVAAPGDADGLVWAHPRAPEELRAVLAEHPGLAWVQLPFAGIEDYRSVLDHDRVWTCAKRTYAETTAEHALALTLGALRHLRSYLRADRWSDDRGDTLFGEPVTVLGGGGITEVLLGLLQPFGGDVTVVRRTGRPLPGAVRTVGPADLLHAVQDARVVILALALTEETEGMVDRAVLTAMRSDAWLVNVARGRHVVTADLVDALRTGAIAGAALDVTDPEPLPEGHPLWDLGNCIITPHVANTQAMLERLLPDLVTENVRRFAAGEDLLGVVDADAGY